MKNRILAIIPARSGSKGLKNKNIKNLNGKPLIAYTIESAIKSRIFQDIVVSTDSDEYAAIAKRYGAYIPFLRPAELSQDNTTTNDVIEYTLTRLKAMGKQYDKFMILQPTSPLRDEEDILSAEELFNKENANCVVSMCECEHSPLWTKALGENNFLDGFGSDFANKGRQKLQKYYRLNGAIYLLRVDYFMNYKNFYKEKAYAYIMKKEKSIDIDDIFDFNFAESIMKNKNILRNDKE